jgi:hypothetical protein
VIEDESIFTLKRPVCILPTEAKGRKHTSSIIPRLFDLQILRLRKILDPSFEESTEDFLHNLFTKAPIVKWIVG